MISEVLDEDDEIDQPYEVEFVFDDYPIKLYLFSWRKNKFHLSLFPIVFTWRLTLKRKSQRKNLFFCFVSDSVCLDFFFRRDVRFLQTIRAFSCMLRAVSNNEPWICCCCCCYFLFCNYCCCCCCSCSLCCCAA